MFFTNVLLKKPKAKLILVMMESMVSGHRYVQIRERLADKIELARFDPYVQQIAMYVEKKKLKSLRGRKSA